MLKICLLAVICFFAVYGIAQIIIGYMTVQPIFDVGYVNSPHTVLVVRNCADCIEATVRSYIWRMMTEEEVDVDSLFGKLIIVDLGSSDDTSEILLRLGKEYECLHILNRDEYIRKIIEL